MKRFYAILFVLPLLFACSTKGIGYGGSVTIPDDVLVDKIRGGWFAQTIGCTYGGPTEFKFKGGLMQDQMPIVWYDDYIYDTFIEDPGLYDDVYMDLTFLEVMSEAGIDAPADLYADRFANAPYKLWHANQAARYNILNGIPAPQSGFWKNNPHSDDIDFQIEADFIGMLAPGMTNAASEICDGIGHIMNYGDGWYGGVYMSALYSLAYVCDDILTIVSEALRSIPQGTKFHDCISDVIRFHKKFPDDWKRCWFEVDKLHSYDVGCPEGVWNGFNIDARINAAYCVIGLLYGEGDFEKTAEISTRCGQDSDCNPATTFGILGVMKGYEAIPDKFKSGVDRIADMPFPYTSLSLNRACESNLELLRRLVVQQGGEAGPDGITVTVQEPQAVRFEQGFEGIHPSAKVVLKKEFTDSLTLEFDGCAIVVEGSINKTGHDDSDYVALLSAYVDGELVEEFRMPYDYITRKYEVFSNYELPQGHHSLCLKLANPHPDYVVRAQEMVVYEAD